jgi:hypothetical protein
MDVPRRRRDHVDNKGVWSDPPEVAKEVVDRPLIETFPDVGPLILEVSQRRGIENQRGRAVLVRARWWRSVGARQEVRGTLAAVVELRTKE